MASNIQPEENESIFEAVKSDNLNAILNIFKKTNIDLEKKNVEGDTALHMAAKQGNEKIVNVLLDRGADIKAKNSTSDTPLHVAAQFGNVKIVSIFLKNGAFIDITNQCDCTPLHMASENGKSKVVKILLERGADYKIKNKDFKTAHQLCGDYEDAIKAFLDIKPDALSKIEKIILLRKASKMNWLNVINSLIKSKVNINCSDGFETPLMIAADNGHNRIVEKLLKHGADVNPLNMQIENCLNNTALHFACRSGNLESVKLLIQYKANLEARESWLYQTPIYSAAQTDNLPIVEYLWKNKADINVKNEYGNTLLHVCARYDSIKTADWLLEKGATIDEVNNEYKTPLTLACCEGSEKAVNLLLSKGANINFKCKLLQNTPLHYTCALNKEKKPANCANIVKILLSHKADATCKNIWNLTALDLAGEKNLQDIVTILENHTTEN